uniref:Uncharacterized protein n=1 Tax=viral metagenome TaxID=1070528 RepID=A0A6M3KV73_9ZZZZ
MKAYCGICDNELKPAPANFDGEPTFVGYLPCPNHPHAPVRFEKLGLIHNGMSHLIEDIVERINR